LDKKLERAMGVGAVVAASTVFSCGFPIVKVLGLPAPTISAIRLIIGVVFLLAVARIARAPWPARWGVSVAAGLFFGFHQLLYIVATQTTSIAIVTLIGALKPLLVTLVSRRAVGEAVPKSFRLWALLALVGVAVVVQASHDDASRSLTGDLLAIVNVLVFTTYFLLAKRARQEGAHTVTFTATTQLVALAVVLPAFFFVGSELPAAGWQWGLIALLALVPGNGHLLVNWAHTRVSAALSVIALSAVPLLASLWAHLIFGEPFGAAHVVGMLIVAVAIEGGRRAEMAHPR
jgi:drug/metabolite transporter (DMT)-like permease